MKLKAISFAWRASAVALLLFSTTAPTEAIALTYQFTALNPLFGESFGQAYGINDLGQVVGWSGHSSGGGQAAMITQATIWNGPTPTALSTLSGGVTSQAFGINNAGVAVGFTHDAPGDRATIWNGTTPTALSPISSGTGGVATAINNAGMVAGYSDLSTGSRQTTVWNGAIPTGLNFLPGTDSSTASFGINESGAVVGNSRTSSPFSNQATIWNGSIPTGLNLLSGFTGSTAFGINDAGIVVGESLIPTQATVWNGGIPTGLGGGIAYDINNDGVVVGVGGDGNKVFATVWIGGVAFDLDTLTTATGWHLIEARAINASGQIVGWGNNPSGDLEAFLLTPTPLPAALPLFVTGLGALGLLGWRRKWKTT